MSETRTGNNLGLLALGLCFTVGLIVTAMIASETALEIRSASEYVEVKGFAERHIVSDWASWSARFTARGETLTEAYERLERDRKLLQKLLKGLDVSKGQYTLSPLTTSTVLGLDGDGNLTNQIVGFELSQEVSLSSDDIDLVTRVSKEASELVGDGVEISSYSPEYFYTQLGALKIEMLAEAAVNARERAKEIAKKSKSDLKKLRGARQGVFQITPLHSTEVTDYGSNDTTSIEKSVKAVVTIRYTLE